MLEGKLKGPEMASESERKLQEAEHRKKWIYKPKIGMDPKYKERNDVIWCINADSRPLLAITIW